MNTLSELAKEIHANSVSKGFKHDNIPTMLALIHSEVSEALEADRNNKYANFQDCYEDPPEHYDHCFEAIVKNTFEDELADVVIRVLDLAESRGIDIAFHIRAKMNYNASRPTMHGGKKY